MRAYSLTHLSDGFLLQALDTNVRQERGAMAVVLAHLAEVDARRLYLPAGFPSMFEFCVRRLHCSEQAAMKRIRAARAARRFPAIFDAVAEGRLHLSAVVLLATHLISDNADELLGAASGRTSAEIEQLLARRFPKPDLPTRIEAIASVPWSVQAGEQLASRPVENVAGELSSRTVQVATGQLSSKTVQVATGQLSSRTVEARSGHPDAGSDVLPVTWPRLKPLSAERFAIQFTIDQSTREKLRYAQELLSHQLPSGDVAQVFDRALDALVAQLEKQKFAATEKPRTPSSRPRTDPRHIPPDVKRAVWARDGGQCTFVSDTGHRCGARKFLEFDHEIPVARGGQATIGGMRLRCRAHNQYEAERVFGTGFMNEKRRVSTEGRPAMKARAATGT